MFWEGDGGCALAPGHQPQITFFPPERTIDQALHYFDICLSHFRGGDPISLDLARPDHRVIHMSLVFRGVGPYSVPWFISPRFPLGAYQVTAQQGAFSAAASFIVRRPRHRFIIAASKDPVRIGDTEEIFLLNFKPRTRQRLLIYHSSPRESGRSASFYTWLTVSLNARGDGSIRFKVDKSVPMGDYYVRERVPSVSYYSAHRLGTPTFVVGRSVYSQ